MFLLPLSLKPFSPQSPISRMREIRSFVADEPDGKVLVNANQLSRLSAMSRHCTKSGSSVGDIANFLSFVFLCIFILSFHSSRNHCTVFATKHWSNTFPLFFFNLYLFFFFLLISKINGINRTLVIRPSLKLLTRPRWKRLSTRRGVGRRNARA